MEPFTHHVKFNDMSRLLQPVAGSNATTLTVNEYGCWWVLMMEHGATRICGIKLANAQKILNNKDLNNC